MARGDGETRDEDGLDPVVERFETNNRGILSFVHPNVWACVICEYERVISKDKERGLGGAKLDADLRNLDATSNAAVVTHNVEPRA